MSTPIKDIDLYLGRLGYTAPPPPTLETLRELQRRHTAAFIFETIATLVHAPVPIDLPSLERKLLHDGRGGYCFELNRLFLALLQRLGFDARGLTARVVMGGPEDAPTARTHMLVLVTIDGVRYTADVGFGGMVPTGPLRLDTDAPQATPHEAYRLLERDGRYLLRAQVAGEWRGLYVFDLQPQVEIDLEVGNWYVSTHPDSPFSGQLRVARTGPGLRKTLGNGSFAVHRLGAPSERRELPNADAVLEVLRGEFELRLPPGPGLHEAIEARLAADGARAVVPRMRK
ncbi:arylamine N-acetyltransferase family protein [Luteimonas sp. R10]|uniref:arylamine N-acetyltransferase family protein n=1 Tax=Luteimonas sp. R10 TaxID=3108176 RepID=UPI003091BF27|nr:arylamine N-acetyltransferase [Luteimonas sp. R10]